MKKNILFTILILSLLLAACSGGRNPATVEPTVVPPEATTTAAPTLAPSPTAEQPAPVPPPEEELVMLRANPWQWISFTSPVEQYSIDNPQKYSLTFNNDATVNIMADCNNAFGSYTTDGSSITIKVGPMTMAACPPDRAATSLSNTWGLQPFTFLKVETCTSICSPMAGR